MVKKPVRSILLGSFILALIYSLSFGEQSKEELKAKLCELRTKKTETMNEYQETIHKINKETEDKIAALKADFRKARDKCLEEKRHNSNALHKEHEAKLRPMLKEEEELIQAIGVDSATDFAKPKTRK